MIKENIIFEKKEAKEYPLLPKRIYQCELLSVQLDRNETYDSKNGKTAAKEYQNDINWQFTLLAGRDESQEKEEQKELRGRNVWESFGKSYLYIGKNGKNDLYRIVEAFLGRELTQREEAEGISSELLNSFIGKQVMLSIEPKTSKKGKTFDNIIDYLSITAPLQSLTEAEKEKARVKDKDEQSGTSTIENGQIVPANTEQGDEIGGHTEESTLNVEEIPFN